MYAAAFTLELYCENQPKDSGGKGMQYIPVNRPSYDGVHAFDEFPHEFVGWDRAEAFRNARKKGWRINTRAGTCYCPKCK